MSENKKLKKKQLKSYTRVTTLVIQMGLIIISATYFGQYLDFKFTNEASVYTIVFALLGIAIGLYITIRGIIHK